MKIIDLINMRAEGKEMPKKIRIDHWCYNFEWVKHIDNYYDENNDIDLMSCLSMDKEELNYEVKIIEEDKKIEKLNLDKERKTIGNEQIRAIDYLLEAEINEIIDYLMENKK